MKINDEKSIKFNFLEEYILFDTFLTFDIFRPEDLPDSFEDFCRQKSSRARGGVFFLTDLCCQSGARNIQEGKVSGARNFQKIKRLITFTLCLKCFWVKCLIVIFLFTDFDLDL